MRCMMPYVEVLTKDDVSVQRKYYLKTLTTPFVYVLQYN